MEKLNVAMLGQKHIPSREGGVEVVVGELATRMVEQGHKVVCYNRKGKQRGGKIYKGVNLKDVFTIDKKGLAAVTSSISATILAAFGNYDIVHIHAEGPAFLCWLPRIFGKKVIVTVHGLDHQRAKWGKFAGWYIKKGEKNAARYADKIIVLSKGVQKYFKDTYRRKTELIPNGVTRPKQRKAEKINSRWGLEKDSYVLFLGRLVPEKGVHYLIRAFENVETDKKLVIAGGSSDTCEYEKKLKRMGAKDDRVIFTGFVQGQILEELYSNAYIYCLPSDLEGMPLSLLEAMSYGNCCLTSDIAECTEVVEDRAVTFKKSNVSDLRDKLQMLNDEEKLVQEYKSGATDFICQKYNWETIVNQTVNLYRK